MIHSILLVQFTCLTVPSTTSLQVLFGLLLGLEPSTSYSMHFFRLILTLTTIIKYDEEDDYNKSAAKFLRVIKWNHFNNNSNKFSHFCRHTDTQTDTLTQANHTTCFNKLCTRCSLITIALMLLLLHSFTGLFSRTTWVSRYHKGKNSLDLNGARDDGVLWW